MTRGTIVDRVEEILAQRYAVRVLWDDDEPGYFVELPELPGCISCGDTFAGALAMLRDAQRGWVQSALYRGLPVPLPTSPQKG